MGYTEIQISNIKLLGEPLHQDGVCRVIRPTDNSFRRYRNSYNIKRKGLGLGTSMLQSLSKLY